MGPPSLSPLSFVGASCRGRNRRPVLQEDVASLRSSRDFVAEPAVRRRDIEAGRPVGVEPKPRYTNRRFEGLEIASHRADHAFRQNRDQVRAARAVRPRRKIRARQGRSCDFGRSRPAPHRSVPPRHHGRARPGGADDRRRHRPRPHRRRVAGGPLGRPRRSARRRGAANADRTDGSSSSALGVGTTPPLARTKSGSSNRFRIRDSCPLIPCWVRPSRSAARVTLRSAASASKANRRRVSNRAISRFIVTITTYICWTDNSES